MKHLEFRVVEITLEKGGLLEIVHNLPLEGPNGITQFINNWAAQTTVFTGENLCAHINSSRFAQLNHCQAMTRAQYEEWTEGNYRIVPLN